MSDILTVKVLDHGFVKLRNLAGPTRREFQDFDADDTDPANTARMSFNNMDEDRTREADLKLADYLMRNKHTSPFEMVECWVEMKMPIFVARQFVRHRTVSINEVSGRYIQLPREWYIPEVVGGKPANAKQGQDNSLHPNIQKIFKEDLDSQCYLAYEKYEYYLKQGVAAEHARLFLHLNHYTHWIWKQDLHNLLHFLALRDHSHAQVESQKYARAIDHMIRRYLPHSMDLYDKYRRLP